jgi:nucleoside-triphosphatase THEP1
MFILNAIQSAVHSFIIFNKYKIKHYEKYKFSIRNGSYGLIFTSCKENKQQTVGSYVVYVDSLENVAQKMLKQTGLQSN